MADVAEPTLNGASVAGGVVGLTIDGTGQLIVLARRLTRV